MTCVVGVEGPDGVVIGTDSFLGSEELRDLIDKPKWFYKGATLLIAYAGDLRPAQVAQHAPRFRRRSGSETAENYLQTVVSENIRQVHRKHDLWKNSDWAFLIGYVGKLYMMQNDYSVCRSSYGYSAIGAGQFFALGALAAQPPDWAAKTRAENALRAAARHSTNVSKPFYFASVASL